MHYPNFKHENKIWATSKTIGALDEVGRGALAGPLVSAVVVFDKGIASTFNDVGLGKVRDSKLLTPNAREKLSRIIREHAIGYSISEISVERIDKHGIGKCTQYAFRKAIGKLPAKPEHLLIDAFYIKYLPKKNQTPVIKGDLKCFTIACASIIAKVHRDNLMRKFHKAYPNYGFDRHKGYGTKLHKENISKNGLSKIHRKSFKIKV